jgi:hypothetical protein
LEGKAGSVSASKSKFMSFRGSKWSLGEPGHLKWRCWRLKMEPWRACAPVVADSNHFDKEQDPDSDPH